ncbi:MAG: prepilin-type N-terminal cleavage/methylation domain-containing protein [Eubacterium sp.]|nr:prepilin-type N-terminal cleavage/methylation domain-containing protein [Eubacterium sp.]MBR1674026.1 prepilin-type N-terminal cleavage/methylation domain-containing protein [Eubacterium sp.]
MKFLRKRKLNTNKNKGMTLVEMIVCFALLSIFVTVSTLVISNVITLYYRVRGESYARQVGDIVAKKITSELSGAEYANDSSIDPIIEKKNPNDETVDGNVITVVDSTDTKISMYADDGILKIYYHKITDENDSDNNREPVIWTFDKKMYNGYQIDSLDFAQACSSKNTALASKYDVTATTNYPTNVIVVYMKLSSPKYGKFTIVRYVKMYNAPETGATIIDTSGD